VVDEVEYIPFGPTPPDVHARLAPLRARRNDPHLEQGVSAWGEISGDDVTAAAMIDRLVHHSEIVTVEGDSYRPKDRDLATPGAD